MMIIIAINLSIGISRPVVSLSHEYLLEQRVLLTLIVDLEVTDLQVNFVLLLLWLEFAGKSDAFPREQSQLSVLVDEDLLALAHLHLCYEAYRQVVHGHVNRLVGLLLLELLAVSFVTLLLQIVLLYLRRLQVELISRPACESAIRNLIIITTLVFSVGFQTNSLRLAIILQTERQVSCSPIDVLEFN